MVVEIPWCSRLKVEGHLAGRACVLDTGKADTRRTIRSAENVRKQLQQQDIHLNLEAVQKPRNDTHPSNEMNQGAKLGLKMIKIIFVLFVFYYIYYIQYIHLQVCSKSNKQNTI